MTLYLNENSIRINATKFSKEWENAHYEKGETQTFYNEFFEIFGVRRKNVSVYEQKVKKLANNNNGFIDLFWPGTLLVEQKSAGRNLSKAREQALDYFISLKETEKPDFILLSDFQTFQLLDLEENTEHHFTLAELPDNIQHFGFMLGRKQKHKDQDPVNIEASLLMSNLHKHLEVSNYNSNDLEILLVRIMFCLFAEDTLIFPLESFLRLIDDRTKEDGSDVGRTLIHLFQVLDTHGSKRDKNLDEDLAIFPYVNGQLFSGTISIPSFNSDMRKALIDCAEYNWTKVSPALFGSLFQTVMLPEKQRQGGAHYTSNKNILKAIEPLFLNELNEEFIKLKKDLSTQRRTRLIKLQNKIASLKFLDPACGCGNFLIIAFRELRDLELKILIELYPKNIEGLQQQYLNLDLQSLSKVHVNQFYGIEIEEFPARIAEAAMWLIDHQANMRLSEQFMEPFVRLPLDESAHINHANALIIDWNSLLPVNECNYIIGNPPFVGKSKMTSRQKQEILEVFSYAGVNAGSLDYVSTWFLKIAQYIQNTTIKSALVSTNSIVQGEQINVLWGTLINQFDIKIHFAHKTFKWTIDDEKTKKMKIAAVHVIIIGFAAYNINNKYLFEYETTKSEPQKLKVNNINPYLIDYENDFTVAKRSKPFCEIPEAMYGSKPVDEGHFFFTDEQKIDFLKQEPQAGKFIKRVASNKEFLYNIPRWCLWLKDTNPSELRTMPLVMERIRLVKQFRLKSKKEKTRVEDSQRATEFAEIRQPDSDYIVIPLHTSANRKYIPFGFCNSDWIIHNSCSFIPNASLYDFGMLSSKMHLTWLKCVGGRIGNEFRYSPTLVYNTFPFPELSGKTKIKYNKLISNKVQVILSIRATYKNSTLADLYDVDVMPKDLYDAHVALDKIVDAAFTKKKFKTHSERVKYLLDEYKEKIDELIS